MAPILRRLSRYIDARGRERLGEGREAFDSALSSPRIFDVPFLLANKQDTPHPPSMSATEIREYYEVWDHHRCDSERRRYGAEEEEEEEGKKRGLASLEVLGVSALEGQGVREAYRDLGDCVTRTGWWSR